MRYRQRQYLPLVCHHHKDGQRKFLNLMSQADSLQGPNERLFFPDKSPRVQFLRDETPWLDSSIGMGAIVPSSFQTNFLLLSWRRNVRPDWLQDRFRHRRSGFVRSGRVEPSLITVTSGQSASLSPGRGAIAVGHGWHAVGLRYW